MAREYQGAEKLLTRDEEKPFERRTFMLLLLSTTLVGFDAAHKDVAAVLKDTRNQDTGRFALRTQIIRDPTRPLGNGAEILQFFMLDPNHDQVRRGGQAGVIYEVVDSAETPLVMLTADEVNLLAYGEGYATPLRG